MDFVRLDQELQKAQTSNFQATGKGRLARIRDCQRQHVRLRGWVLRNNLGRTWLFLAMENNA